MENKPLKALVGSIQKFSTEDGPGIRTTVFLKGCPLRCLWCHNPELIGFEQEIIGLPNSCIHCGYCIQRCELKAIHVGEHQEILIDRLVCNNCLECVKGCYAGALQTVAREMTAEEVMSEVIKDKGFYDNTGGGMTISGGELLSQIEFVEEIVLLAEKQNISVCLDTSGFGDGQRLYNLAKKDIVTQILYDMKAIDYDVHRSFTGQSNKTVLDNLKVLAWDNATRKKIQMRMPLISNVNDSWDIIERTAGFFRENSLDKVTLLPYHNLGVSKMRNIGGKSEVFSAPTDEYVNRIKRCFEQEAKMKVDVLGRLEQSEQ